MPNVRNGFLTTAVSTLAVVLASLSTGAQANPSGGSVVAGTANIDQQPNLTAINQASDKAIIDWRSFDVAPAELVQFNQPGRQSITLNRVMGGDPSAILGSIKANGQVWLINPNGIAFGQSARVDVTGLLATTLNIDNADFMAGRYRFTDSGSTPASVTNAGTLTISGAGLAALVAPTVANSGVIQARLGHIDLAATHGFTLDFYGDGLVNFLLNKDTNAALANTLGAPAVSNSGSLIADGGSVLLTADTAKSVVDQTINMDGYIQARTVGSSNGAITLDAGSGAVLVSGVIDATGATGGHIAVTGGAVDLSSTATLDASGDTGGGTVLVGGDEHGQGALANAQTTSVAEGARIRVSARTLGDAGKAIVWSNERTDYAGTIEATGGSEGGNGGFAEVSGHNLLNFTGMVDLRAARGAHGTLLLDPRNVIINATGGTAPALPASGPITLNPASDDSILLVSTLQTALGLGNVIVTTGNDGTQAGDITVTSNLAWGNASNLTLSAHRHVIVNDAVTLASTGSGNLALRADRTGSGTGTVTFNGTGKVDYSGSTGLVSIFYNPSGGYTSPTSFATHMTTNGAVANQLVAYMLVNDFNQIQAITTNLTGNYALGRDIDISSISDFTPIGAQANPFTGALNGDGHTISGLSITTSYVETGFFGRLNGSVSNLKLTNASIQGSATGTNRFEAGLLAGVNFSGTVTNVSVSGSVSGEYTSGSSMRLGGLIGNNLGNVLLSNSSASVTGGPGSECCASYVLGGLVGINNDSGIVRDSYATGTVTGGGGDIGGLVGYNRGNILRTYATGDVTGGAHPGDGGVIAGGLVGWHTLGSISDSYARGDVDGGPTNAGGLVELIDVGANVINSYSTGSVTAAESIGGAINRFGFGGGSANNVYWDTDTSGTTISAGGNGLTTTQLKTSLPPGFDPTVWAIDPVVNDGYPYLRWQIYSSGVPAPNIVTFGEQQTPIFTGSFFNKLKAPGFNVSTTTPGTNSENLLANISARHKMGLKEASESSLVYEAASNLAVKVALLANCGVGCVKAEGLVSELVKVWSIGDNLRKGDVIVGSLELTNLVSFKILSEILEKKYGVILPVGDVLDFAGTFAGVYAYGFLTKQ